MKTYLTSLLRRYAVAGASGSAVHFALLMLLAPNLGPLLASTLGAAAGAVVNYSLLKGWVFSERTARPLNYVAMCLLSIAINTLLMATISSVGIDALPAQIFSSGAVMMVNFAVSNRWIFKYETNGSK